MSLELLGVCSHSVFLRLRETREHLTGYRGQKASPSICSLIAGRVPRVKVFSLACFVIDSNWL